MGTDSASIVRRICVGCVYYFVHSCKGGCVFSEQMCLSMLVVTICHYCYVSSFLCVCMKARMSVTKTSRGVH